MKRKFLFLIVFICFFISMVVYFDLHSVPGHIKFSDNFDYNCEIKCIFGKERLTDIPPNIIKFEYNKDFVIVKQKPRYYYDDMYDYNENYSYDVGLKEYYYWLILLNEKTVLGPLLYDEFKSYCEQFNVELIFDVE